MKKLVLVTIVAFVLLFAMVGIASANGGPHGGYTATTDACAGCHRAHTASGAKLLVASDTTALCITCHGASGNGADTNVEDGYFVATRSASTIGEANTTNSNGVLLGGGFTNYKGAAVTSKHDVGIGGATAGTDAWGNGVNRGVAAAMSGGASLSCASCHDPHGSPNYRIIKETVNGNAVTVAQVDEGSANKDYDTEQWGDGQSNVCAACHSAYHVQSAGSGSDSAVAANGGYAHRVGMPWNYLGVNVNPETTGYTDGNSVTVTVPLATTAGGDTVECQTCHLPHGTSAAMTGFANGANSATTNDSALLRLDNRGVCEACHQK